MSSVTKKSMKKKNLSPDLSCDPAKRFKRPTKDPLIFVHEHCLELLFQHFDAADVLILSETDFNWWQTIGRSKQCMSKINLGIDKWLSNETESDMVTALTIIGNTSRKYQHARINCQDNVAVSKTALEMLPSLAPSLKTLYFQNTDYEDIGGPPYEFPKLEYLQFINNSTPVDNLLLAASTELVELNLKHHYWGDPVPVIECLQRNNKLKVLKLWDASLTKIFALYEPGMFQFKLKRFTTGCEGNFVQYIEANLISFLRAQNELEAVRLRPSVSGVSKKIVRTIYRLPLLTVLHLEAVGEVQPRKLPVNQKVVELRLSWAVNTVEKLSVFVTPLPNLRTLHLKQVDRAMLQHLAMHTTELRTVHYYKSDYCPTCFNSFIASARAVNKELEIIRDEDYFED